MYVAATHIKCLAYVNKTTVNKYNAFHNHVLGMTNRTEAIYKSGFNLHNCREGLDGVLTLGKQILNGDTNYFVFVSNINFFHGIYYVMVISL